MSVIVYKAGVMAGDTRAWVGRGKSSPGQKRKIHRMKDGSLLGVSSSQIGMADRFADWVKSGASLANWHGRWPDSLSALLIKPNGQAWMAEDSLHFTGPIKGKAFSVGSGSDFAIGAMAAGKTARQAALIAARLCPYSAPPVQTLKLKVKRPC